MKIFLKKNDFTIGLAVILIFASYIFLPFFIYTPLVQISMDTFTYSYLAKLIFDGNIPALELITDLPIGYPLIIYFIRFLELSFNHLVFIQLIFYLISFMFLCLQLSRLTKFGGLITAFTFVFYSLNSHTIRHIFKISPDSIYMSFLILLVGGLLYYLREKNKLSLFIVLFSVLGAVLLRSNGIYLYFILVILLYNYVNNKNGLTFYLVSCLAFFFVISALNYRVKGYFAPFDKNRVLIVVSSLSSEDSSIKNDPVKKVFQRNKPPRSQMFLDYFNSFLERHASYYYSMQKTNFERITKNKIFSNLEQGLFDGRITVKDADKNLLHFMFEEEKDYSFIGNNVSFETGKKNFWLYSVYLIQEIIFHLKFNAVFYILFFVCFIYNVILFFSKKKIDWRQTIFLIHLISLIILPFIHGRFIYRYIHVSEFIIYIEALLFLKIMFSKISYKKID